MKKIILSLLICVSLTACNEDKTAVVSTPSGNFFINSSGLLHRIEGNKLVEVKVDNVDPEKGITKTLDREVPTPQGIMTVSVKAKIYPDKTSYIIYISKKLKEGEGNEQLSKALQQSSSRTIMGIKSITVVASDKDDFSVGEDNIPLTYGWTNIVDKSGKPYRLEYKGSFPSPKTRFNESTFLGLQWTEG